MRSSFAIDGPNFSSALGSVSGTIYAGRTAAGGVGRSVDIDGDGKADATFSRECGFELQLRDGRVIAAESDRDVSATIRGKRLALKRHQPVQLAN